MIPFIFSSHLPFPCYICTISTFDPTFTLAHVRALSSSSCSSVVFYDSVHILTIPTDSLLQFLCSNFEPTFTLAHREIYLSLFLYCRILWFRSLSQLTHRFCAESLQCFYFPPDFHVGTERERDFPISSISSTVGPRQNKTSTSSS